MSRYRLGLAPTMLLLLASTSGTLVANLYYVQPLLEPIAGQFGTSSAQAGFLVTLTQVGYALGVLFLVPLGDVTDRRRLLTILLVIVAVGLACIAASPSLALFSAGSLLTGIASCAAQVIVPFAASLAPAEAQGEVVGRVMTGNLLGILLARTISGFVAQALGWRALFILASLLILILLICLRRVLPSERSVRATPYTSLLKSLAMLPARHRELRHRASFGFLGMASFSAMWTGLTLLLSAPPYDYPVATIGLFGLLGAGAALATGPIGKLGDRGHMDLLVVALAATLVASWGLLAFGTTSLVPVVAGILLLDIAFMGLQVLHAATIYRLVPDARSRLTSIFITSSFVGASLGSAMASAAYEHFGWHGVCAAGAAPSIMLLLTAAPAWLRSRPAPTSSGGDL